MAFGVFIYRTDSIYNDSPAERYQFPRQYLSRAQACIGDWIIYYESRNVAETRGYFAVAKVRDITPDLSNSDMYFAGIEPGTYLDFTSNVPFRGASGVAEQGVLNDQGRISGRAQSAIRSLSASDFTRIVDLGFDDDCDVLPRRGPSSPVTGMSETQTPFQVGDPTRNRVNFLGSRIQRDRIFRWNVLRAYDSRCAMTGLKLINGGGRAEVEAAHIQPVQANGQDIIGNGIALSGTAHWVFDRGLVSIADDFRILISSQVNDIESVHAMINKTGKILPPLRKVDFPHKRFLEWHRENCFKL